MEENKIFHAVSPKDYECDYWEAENRIPLLFDCINDGYIDEDTADEIIARYYCGETLRSISRTLNISMSTIIRYIKKGADYLLPPEEGEIEDLYKSFDAASKRRHN